MSPRLSGPRETGPRFVTLFAVWFAACVVPNPAYQAGDPDDGGGLAGAGGASDMAGDAGLAGFGGVGVGSAGGSGGILFGAGGQVSDVDAIAEVRDAAPPPTDAAIDTRPTLDATTFDVAPPPLCPSGMGVPFMDEDRDGVHDRCDNCPSDPNVDQMDRGEANVGQIPDGVGDACDPQPTTPGDKILLFDGFGGTQLDGAWSGNRSSTSVQGGDLHFDLATSGSGDRSIQHPGVLDVEVVVRFSVVAWAPGAVFRNFWVGVRAANNRDTYACSARKQADDETSLAFFDFGMYGTPLIKIKTPIDLDVPNVLRARIKGSQLSCELNNVRYDRVGATGRNASIQIGGGLVSVRIASVTVYALGN